MTEGFNEHKDLLRFSFSFFSVTCHPIISLKKFLSRSSHDSNTKLGKKVSNQYFLVRNKKGNIPQEAQCK
jgi:hypothetical protein